MRPLIIGENAEFGGAGESVPPPASRRAEAGYRASMPRLTKIYTKTGDAGLTGLGDGARVPKHCPRVEAYGEVDEANSALGVAIVSLGDAPALARVRDALLVIQQDLFDVGADLCVPRDSGEQAGSRLRVTPDQIARLERLIDRHNAGLPPLESFIMPGGTEAAARLHVARAVTRRAERRVAALIESEPAATSPDALVYLNRLSDLLFVLARVANGGGDVLWKPGSGRDAGD